MLGGPEVLNAAVGDTVTIRVTAYDSAGAEVAGAVFFVSTDGTHWIVISPPIGEYAMLETPRLVRFLAIAPGTVRLRANSWNDRAYERAAPDSATITVRAP